MKLFSEGGPLHIALAAVEEEEEESEERRRSDQKDKKPKKDKKRRRRRQSDGRRARHDERFCSSGGASPISATSTRCCASSPRAATSFTSRSSGRPRRAGALVDGLIAEYPDNITVGVAPGRADDDWSWVVSRLRPGLEYLRYQHKLFDDTPMLRERSRERTPGSVRHAGRRRRPLRAVGTASDRSGAAVARAIDAGRSGHPRVRRGAAARISCSSRRSSRSGHRRSTTCAPRGRSAFPRRSASGAGTTCRARRSFASCPIACSSGMTRRSEEALTLHGVPAERIVVTGAQCFDKWFDRAPSRDRETFCRQIGLPADRPILLYVCSAPFSGSPPEAPFVVDWIRRIRDERVGAAAQYADSRPASSVASSRVGGHRSDAVRRRGAVGQRSRSMPTRAPTTSTRCITARSSPG